MVSIVLNNLMQRLSLRGVLIEAAVDGWTLVVLVEVEAIAASGLAGLWINGEVEVKSHVSSQSRLSILDQVLTRFLTHLTISEVITAALGGIWLSPHRHQSSVITIVLISLVRISQRYVFRKGQLRGASELLILLGDSRTCITRRNSVNIEEIKKGEAFALNHYFSNL